MIIAGIVVVYYPDEDDLLQNITSYLGFLDRLYIIDNTPETRPYQEKFKQLPPPITYIKNDRNLGVASALNMAVSAASEEGYRWLLTMDQDSRFEPAVSTQYLNLFNEKFQHSQDVAIVCLKHGACPRSAVEASDYTFVTEAITSGSLLNIPVCRKLNGFDEKLFIDEVDFEYCYRCILNGYKIAQFEHLYLTHNLGVPKQTGYFGFFKKSSRILHSPFRIYFMVRNYFYVSSKYAKAFPKEFKLKRKQLLVTLKNNLLFSGHFFKVLFAAVRGYLHYRTNNFLNK